MNSRRNFLRDAGCLGLSFSLGALNHAVASPRLPQVPGAMPTEAQQQWMNLKFGMFIHFGINTYYDTEWSDGTLSADKFHPNHLDTDQWCMAAKEAGMKYIVLVCKHHDGFCNWPTKYTEYCVRNTPSKKDIVGSVAKSAQKHGLQLGLYYSLWDRHEKTHDTNDHAYVDFMKNQLQELLTQYGPIVELWFDGFWKKQKSGWKKADGSRPGAEEFIAAWRAEGAYRWQMDHLYQYVKTLQPGTLVMNNATTAFPGVPLHPVDILSGEKATSVISYQKEWKWLGKDIFLPMQVETTMSQQGRDQFKSGSWFWHPWDHSVASRNQVLGWRKNASDMGANLLLNCGPMASGKLRPEDEKVLRSLNG